jgi:hypothetical protein
MRERVQIISAHIYQDLNKSFGTAVKSNADGIRLAAVQVPEY